MLAEGGAAPAWPGWDSRQSPTPARLREAGDAAFMNGASPIHGLPRSHHVPPPCFPQGSSAGTLPIPAPPPSLSPSSSSSSPCKNARDPRGDTPQESGEGGDGAVGVSGWFFLVGSWRMREHLWARASESAAELEKLLLLPPFPFPNPLGGFPHTGPGGWLHLGQSPWGWGWARTRWDSSPETSAS